MSADRLFNIHFKFPVGIALLVTILVVGSSCIFFYVTGSKKETLIFFAAVLTAGSATSAAFYSARTLNLALQKEDAIRDRENSLDELSKKQLALRFSERWSASGMHYARDACRQVYDCRGKSPEEIIAFAESTQTKNNITNTLNFFEEMAFAIEHKVAHEELVREQYSGVVTTVFAVLKPWIDQERVNRGRPKIWDKVEEMHKKWSSLGP